jgi:signal transduction histidine kinase
MRRRHYCGRPSFFWQGLLIVLPVGLLAALGLASLRQDHRLAEEEAGQRAREIIRQLATGLGQRAGTRLAAKPDEGEWAAAVVSETGELLAPPDWEAVPTPPDWFKNLSSEQLECWRAARSLASSTNATLDEAGAAWRKFIATTPTPDAQTNAEFGLACLHLRTNAPPDAIEQWQRLAESQLGARTESGLPLPAVACALALRAAAGSGLTEPLLQLLRRQVDAPSLLTPRFLSEAERLVRTGPRPALEAVRAMQRDWERQEGVRKLVRQLQGRPWLAGVRMTNLWIRIDAQPWLATFRPDDPKLASGSSRKLVGTNGTAVTFFPKPILERAFGDALLEPGVTIPPYFALRLELEGEPLTLPAPQASRDNPSRRLAAMAGSLSLASGQGAPGVGPPAAGVALELVPGAPTFALSLDLADPASLYARQRQRTLWFGAVILTAALAALIGFVRARRAFLREHQLSELKTNFVSSVSHELRAPIASVRLMAESLERGKVCAAGKQQEYYGFIVRECRRLSSLIANVLDFSRIEQGRKEYEFEPTDLAALMSESVQLMQTGAAEREVALRLDLPGRTEDLSSMLDSSSRAADDGQGRAGSEIVERDLQPCLDGRALQQALVNLIDNAIKHSPKGEVVTVGLGLSRGPLNPGGVPPRARGPWLRLWVEDHGPGIPAAEQERIFERFYRLGSELRRETQGVGIGLSIVKHIVEAHRGRVVVQSAPDKGSRFTIELPARPEVAEPIRE